MKTKSLAFIAGIIWLIAGFNVAELVWCHGHILTTPRF